MKLEVKKTNMVAIILDFGAGELVIRRIVDENYDEYEELLVELEESGDVSRACDCQIMVVKELKMDIDLN